MAHLKQTNKERKSERRAQQRIHVPTQTALTAEQQLQKKLPRMSLSECGRHLKKLRKVRTFLEGALKDWLAEVSAAGLGLTVEDWPDAQRMARIIAMSATVKAEVARRTAKKTT